MQLGIAVGGTIITDNNKYIDDYPTVGMLTTIISDTMSVGGCVPNVGIDLAKIDDTLNVLAYGVIGDDDRGSFVKNELIRYGVNVDNVGIIHGEKTAFTDVMTIKKSGLRTFFTHSGVNDKYKVDMIDLDEINVSIFHFGYPLLMKNMDAKNKEYGTELAFLFHQLQNKGIKTSLDLVSKDSEMFREVAVPVLKYCDYLIINEIEAARLAEFDIENQGVSTETLGTISKEIYKLGFSGVLVIHAPEGGWVFEKSKDYTFVKSFELDSTEVVGTVGAGDAFCAGFLYSMYKEKDYKEALEFANATAACNLSALDSISGVKSYQEIMNFIDERK